MRTIGRFGITALGLSCCIRLAGAGSPDVDPPYGLEQRVAWTTSRVVGSPDPPPPYRARRAYPGLSFRHPVYLLPEPGSDRLIVVEQEGHIHSFRDDPAAQRAEPFVTISGHELYSLAFHPQYRTNGQVFVFANGPAAAKPKRNRFLRYTVRPGPRGTCDPASEWLIIEWDSPGHNGGDLAFGADGDLYLASGDGTSGSDTAQTGQDLRDLDSGVLRIDVDHPSGGRAYGIPADNPFINHPGARPEIWAYGLRNPWRMSIDPATGDLWVGDVGQDLWEMIHLVRRGGNYGWSVYEGSHPFQLSRPRGPTPISRPIVEHHHSEARSIIGGLVYHGKQRPELAGAYIYGDYVTGRVWGLRHQGGTVTWHQELAHTSLQIVGFGQDHAGELYLVDYAGGLYALEPAPRAPAAAAFPRRLSETGLFASVADHRPQPGVIAYSVNSPLWSDGAAKERFVALPGTAAIGFAEREPWTFPAGTVLVKTFSLARPDGRAARRIETRLLTFQQGEWRGYSYRWNEQQTDADLVAAAGRDEAYEVADQQAPSGRRGQTWHFPSRAECMVCHSRAAGFVLGLNTLQLNRTHSYGKVADNQLRTLAHIGVLHADAAAPPLARPASLPRLPDPYDPAVERTARVRSWLHANCAQCHVPDGGGNSAFDLHFATPLEKTRLIDAVPLHDAYGIAQARLVAPGAPERSLLYVRVARTGPGRMPPLASSVVDATAVQLLGEWIRSLSTPDRPKL